MIGPAWVATVLDLLVWVALVAVAVGILFSGTVRATGRAADGFAAVACRLSRTADRRTDDCERDRPDVVFDAETTDKR